jgi:hypothetical protein
MFTKDSHIAKIRKKLIFYVKPFQDEGKELNETKRTL